MKIKKNLRLRWCRFKQSAIGEFLCIVMGSVYTALPFVLGLMALIVVLCGAFHHIISLVLCALLVRHSYSEAEEKYRRK